MLSTQIYFHGIHCDAIYNFDIRPETNFYIRLCTNFDVRPGTNFDIRLGTNFDNRLGTNFYIRPYTNFDIRPALMFKHYEQMKNLKVYCVMKSCVIQGWTGYEISLDGYPGKKPDTEYSSKNQIFSPIFVQQ